MAKLTLPEMTSGMDCAAPRNGMCSDWMPVFMRNNSPDRCGVVPTPDELKVTPWGRALAQVRNSCTVFAGCSAETTSTLQFSQIVDT